jgi:helix-turn-helix protein
VSRRRKWWKQSTRQRRLVTEEIAYLIVEGPLVISEEAKRLFWELWRRSRDSAWPTHEQYAQLLQVSRWTVQRMVQELEDAGMAHFERPYAAGKPSVYKLFPPSLWQYRDGWQYLGEYDGWLDPATGERVQWPLNLLTLPRTTTGGSQRTAISEADGSSTSG